MKKILLFFFVFILSLCNITFGEMVLPDSQAQSFYAQDNAKMLKQATIDHLNLAGRTLRDKTKAQLVVVTIDSLGDNGLEEYANALFRKFKLGDAQLNNGCLILLARQEKKIRIEVGYGLEGALPDGYVGKIRDNDIIPAFKKNDYDGGIRKAYDDLYQKIAQEYKVDTTVPGSDTEPAATKPKDNDDDDGWFYIILGVAFFLGLVIFVLLVVWGVLSSILEAFGLKKSNPVEQSTKKKRHHHDDDSFWGGGDSGGDSGGDFGGGGDSGGGGASGGW